MLEQVGAEVERVALLERHALSAHEQIAALFGGAHEHDEPEVLALSAVDVRRAVAARAVPKKVRARRLGARDVAPPELERVGREVPHARASSGAEEARLHVEEARSVFFGEDGAEEYQTGQRQMIRYITQSTAEGVARSQLLRSTLVAEVIVGTTTEPAASARCCA